MNRTSTNFLAATLLSIATATSAQDAAGPVPSVEITIVPGGATTFVRGDDTGEPSFTNYDAGAAFAVNLTRILAFEGEVTGSFGRSQSLTFASIHQQLTPPNLLNYSGNVVVSLSASSAFVPFVTVGAGGLSVFERAEFVQRADTFFAGNVGGGLKWRSRRWGLRADYRFLAVRRHNTQFAEHERPRPDFFGKETRLGHRVFGGTVLIFE